MRSKPYHNPGRERKKQKKTHQQRMKQYHYTYAAQSAMAAIDRKETSMEHIKHDHGKNKRHTKALVIPAKPDSPGQARHTKHVDTHKHREKLEVNEEKQQGMEQQKSTAYSSGNDSVVGLEPVEGTILHVHSDHTTAFTWKIKREQRAAKGEHVVS